MNETYKRILKYGLSLLIVVVCIYFAIKDVDLSKLWQDLAHANYWWVLLSVPVMLVSHWVRAVRWKTMLNPIKKDTSIKNLFSAVMVGYLFNNVFPRGGEFVRPFVFSRREKISYSSTFATIILERVLDVLSLMLILGFAFILLKEKIARAITAEIDMNKVLIIGGMLFLVIIISFYPPFIEFILRTVIKPFSAKLYDKINELFQKFKRGFDIIKNPSQYLRLFLESMLIWFLYATPMFLMFHSLGFQAELNLGFMDGLLLIIVAGVAVTIAPAPGAIGIYHVMIQNSMMKLYGISPEQALAYATITHASNYLVQVGFGALFLLRENIKKIPFSEKMLRKEDDEIPEEA